MSKLTYYGNKAINKRMIRKYLMEEYAKKCDYVVTLAGPDLKKNVISFIKLGFQKILIHENDPAVAIKQVNELQKLTMVYKGVCDINWAYGDVLQFFMYKWNYDEDATLFDLDFCARIETVAEHMLIFPQNTSIFTVSEYGVDKFSTIGKYSHICGIKKAIVRSVNDSQRILLYDDPSTGKPKQTLFTRYRDTSPMVIINQL